MDEETNGTGEVPEIELIIKVSYVVYLRMFKFGQRSLNKKGVNRL